MSLEQLYYVSQIAAVVLILGSLVAIFLQQRQANAIARADMTQRVTATRANNIREIMVNRELAEIYRKVMFDHDELSPVETTRILIFFGVIMGSHSVAYRAVDKKLIDPGYLDQAEHTISMYLTKPLFAREWRRLQRIGTFPPDYAAYINGRFAAIYPDHDSASVKATTATPDA